MRNPFKTVFRSTTRDNQSPSADERKTSQFRKLLRSPDLEFLIEAHNGISARIAEEAGFRGIWASGLSLSAQFGVRDSNEASWTQVLEMLEFMSDATQIPILLDGDTGYGNFNNMRRLVQKLEQRNVAAVCIEDKLFPKANSFIDGTKQRLADMQEFCGKIKAGKDAQTDDEFSIIARVEALIAGWGMREALRRAEAYHEAGADGILIHSARPTADEVLRFMQQWGNRCPVVIVPTKYYATPTDVFRDAGFSIVIWANHMLRSAVAAMEESARVLVNEQSLLAIEDRIAPVGEIFRLQGASELKDAEARYLPRADQACRAVVLAASRGAALGELTEARPKTMVEVRGKALLSQIVDAYNAAGIRDITVVRGYRKESVDHSELKYVDNDEYADTGELVSLARALSSQPEAENGLIVSYGDVLFKRYILETLDVDDEDFVIAVDTDWKDSVNRNRAADYVSCSQPYSRHSFYARTLLAMSGEDLEQDKIHGEWMGFLKVSGRAFPRFCSVVEELAAREEYRRAKIHHLLSELVGRGEEIRVIYTTGNWLDVDSLEDVIAAGAFA